MAVKPKRDTHITVEEFEKRLIASNERARQEIATMEENLRQLDESIARKEAFIKKLDQIIADAEKEEAEITAAEKQMRPVRTALRRRLAAPAQGYEHPCLMAYRHDVPAGT